MAISDLIIPAWVRWLIAAGALALAALGGAVVNGWRIEANYADELRRQDREIYGLKLAVVENNAAVDKMRVEKDAADAGRRRAEAEAVAQRAAAKKRDDWISRLSGTCDDNLKAAWERR